MLAFDFFFNLQRMALQKNIFMQKRLVAVQHEHKLLEG